MWPLNGFYPFSYVPVDADYCMAYQRYNIYIRRSLFNRSEGDLVIHLCWYTCLQCVQVINPKKQAKKRSYKNSGVVRMSNLRQWFRYLYANCSVPRLYLRVTYEGAALYLRSPTECLQYMYWVSDTTCTCTCCYIVVCHRSVCWSALWRKTSHSWISSPEGKIPFQLPRYNVIGCCYNHV